MHYAVVTQRQAPRIASQCLNSDALLARQVHEVTVFGGNSFNVDERVTEAGSPEEQERKENKDLARGPHARAQGSIPHARLLNRAIGGTTLNH